MYRGHSGQQAIAESCDHRVDALPRCHFNDVLNRVFADEDISDIRDACEPCLNPMCDINDGDASCSLPHAPQGVKEGDTCTCFTYRGPVQGELSCNN